MKNNVINMKRRQKPNDLRTFKELEIECGYKYGYLYKWACLESQIPIYIDKGVLSLSKQDVLDFEMKKVEEKYGRNKQKKI